MLNEFIAFTGKTLSLPEDAVKELLFQKDEDGNLTETLQPEALDKLLDLDQQRVKKLRESVDTKGISENFYKKGKSEALTALEQTLKQEFGYDGEEQGVDLVKSIVAKKTAKPLPEDQVKVHPLYLNLERQAKEAAEKVRSEYEAKIQEIQHGYKRQQTIGAVTNKALEILDSLRPVLGENPSVAQTRKQDFARIFEAFDYEIVDNEIVVKKGDQRLEDAHGNRITFNQLVQEEAARRFDFLKQDPKANGGNANTSGNGLKVVPPKTEAEFIKAFANAKTPQERAEIEAAWKAVNSAN